MADPRRTRAWRKLRDQVVDEEPQCTLRFPGKCTGRSQTADHIKPVHTHPQLALIRGNLRGACHPCNRHRAAHGHIEPTRPPALDFFDTESTPATLSPPVYP